MSAVAEGADASSWWSRAQAWSAHHERVLMMWVFVLFTVTATARLFDWFVGRDTLYAVLSMPGLVAIMLWWVVLAPMTRRHHHGGLCEVCIGRAPLDPEAQVERYSTALRAYHALYDREAWVLVPVLYVAVRTVFSPPETVLTVLSWAVQLVMFVGLDWTSSHHRALLPWCPWCRHGGRGGGEHVCPPVPVPVPPSRSPDRVSV